MRRRALLTLAGAGLTGGSVWVATGGLASDDGLPVTVETVDARGSTAGSLAVPGTGVVTVVPPGSRALGTLLDAGARVAFGDGGSGDDGEDGGENGSDDGGENERRTGKGVYDPLAAVDAAVERGVETTAALRAATGGGTYAGGDEERFGTLTVGGAADFVVLERSPWAADSIVDIDVEMTVVDGAVVHGAH